MLQDFETQFREDLAKSSLSFMGTLKTQAFDRFRSLGFPTPRMEEWKYTSVTPITQTAFKQASPLFPSPSIEQELKSISLKTQEIRLVFINGFFSPQLSSIQRLPEGVIAGSLAEAILQRPDLVQPHLGRLTRHTEISFTALNTSFIQDGAFIFIPPGMKMKQPIQLIFLTGGGDEPIVSYPRVLILAGSHTEISLLEIYGGEGQIPYFTNAVTEIIAGENASIDHFKIQQESDQAFHVASFAAEQDRQSRLRSYNISLGGALTRNDLSTILNAEGSECNLKGLYLAEGKQHVDHHTVIDHAKPHCVSDEFYKGILDGKAQGVFNGKIIVRPHAAKTSARQTNKNLLLSNEASINTKPLLEIYNNDVKCNHGATIGRLDPNQIFYLQSRGIDRAHAQSLLTYAFASDLIGEIKMDELRYRLQCLFLARLMKKNWEEA